MRRIHLQSLCFAALLVCAIGITAQSQSQNPFPRRPGQVEEDRGKLPNGKSQKDAIANEDYKKNLEDARSIVRLAESLRDEIEKNEQYIVSMTAVKKADEIEKLSKRIRSRMKRN